MIITSKDNQKIKEIKKLKNKKNRKDKFIVEGSKMIQEAIEANAEIELIVVRSDCKHELELYKYETLEVAENIFNDLTDVVSPQGILAVIKKQKNDKTIDTNDDYILALDGIQDPGNLGTIIRTADAANLKQIIVSNDTVDCYLPKVIRSTMGAIYRVKIITVQNLADELEKLKKFDFEIVTTELSGNKSIYDLNYNKKIVVIGNEANGVREEIKKISDLKVKIPILGKTESLNASVAAGLMVYEYVRQKLKKD